MPLAFYTGYDRAMMPAEFADAARLEKPVETERLRTVVGRLCRQMGDHQQAGEV